MIRYAIHLSTLCERWDDPLIPLIEHVKAMGYDGVEFPLLDPFNFPLDRYLPVLKKLGIQGLCSTGLGPETDIGSYQPLIAEQGVDHLKKCVDIAAAMHSPHLTGVTYAPWGDFQVRDQNQERYTRMIENMRIVCDYAASKGVKIYFELINRFETSWLNTVEDGLAWLHALKRDNVGLHFDTFHANIEEKSMLEALRKGSHTIQHVHFAENDRGLPGSGSIHWADIKQGLEDIHYQGWISLECYTSPKGEVGLGTYTWRAIEDDPFWVAKEGLKAMKKVMS